MSTATRPHAVTSASAPLPDIDRETLRVGYAAARIALADLHAIANPGPHQALTTVERLDDLRQQVDRLNEHYLPLAHLVIAGRQCEAYLFAGREHDSLIEAVHRAASLLLIRVDAAGPEVAPAATREWADRAVVRKLERDLDAELAAVEGRPVKVPVGEKPGGERQPADKPSPHEPTPRKGKTKRSPAVIELLDCIFTAAAGESLGPASLKRWANGREAPDGRKSPPGFGGRLRMLLDAAGEKLPCTAKAWKALAERYDSYRKQVVGGRQG